MRETSRGGLHGYGLLGALLGLVLVFQATTGGRLLAPDNVAALVQQNAYVLVLAIGMVMVIVNGHIDLSVGSVVAFVGALAGWALTQTPLPWPLIVLLGVLVGALIGGWNGVWVAYAGIPSFIVTLAGMLVFRGLAIVVAGTTFSDFPDGFNRISTGSVPHALGYLRDLDGMTLLIGALALGGFVLARRRRRTGGHGPVPSPAGTVVGALLIVAVTWLLAASAAGTPLVLVLVGALLLAYSGLMDRTVFGRHVYAVGGNPAAATLSGIDTRRVTLWVFVHMGALAGVAAIVTTARAGAAPSSAGQGFELDAIAAAFIGGAAVHGGVGRIAGAVTGALIMGVLNLGLSIMDVDAAWQMTVKGLVLLAAVQADLVGKRRAGRAAVLPGLRAHA